jgi:fatty acid desaturase
MKLHPRELALARAHEGQRDFEALTTSQVHLVMERGRALYKWFKRHPGTHNLINGLVVVSIFAADGCALLGLPTFFLAPEEENTTSSILLAGVVVGSVHSWLLYSLTVFSLHEGAAHDAIFVGTGPFRAVGRFLGRSLCRIAGAEPNQYAECHMAHHAKFGTEEDSEFLNFVLPRRYWLTFLPFATFINFTDFLAHRPMTYTRNRLISSAVGLVYNGAYALLMYRWFGAAFTLFTLLVVLPHVGFYVDRVRQFTEHNLMPLDNRNGARSFGVGFWGLLIGGGPWGQPCHLVHHMVASLPWYQQIVLHRYFKRLLTPRQREQFLIAPVIGFPTLLWRIVSEANRFAREQGTQAASVAAIGNQLKE